MTFYNYIGYTVSNGRMILSDELERL